MSKLPTHIRLVDTKGEDPALPSPKTTVGKRSTRKGEQLRLDLDGEHHEKRVVLVAMDSIHGRMFSDLIFALRPQIVLDMRHAIRFDLPGTSRAQIFARFTEVQAFYATASIPWHELKASDFMIDRGSLSHRLHHEILERTEHQIMILLPAPNHARYLRSYLNRKLSERAEQDWEIKEVI